MNGEEPQEVVLHFTLQSGSALPDAFVGLDGVYDLIPLVSPEVLQAKPAECIRNNLFTYVARKPKRSNVSFRMVVGAEPELNSQAQAFRDALRAVGYSAEVLKIPGMGHDSMVTPWPETVDAIAALLRP